MEHDDDMSTRRTETPARTVRQRVRAEMTDEIKAAARRHVAEQGAASLSLRAVAREVGLVSSAVYRYFPSRDDLLTALIVDAYDAIGAVAEATEAGRRRSAAERVVALATAMRAWAGRHRHEYALIYGSPVPGYEAPVDTVDPATRVSLVFLRILADGVASGEIDPAPTGRIPRSVRSDLAGLRAATALDIPDPVLLRGLALWSQLLGSISLELFGHLHNVLHDHDAYFETQMAAAARRLVSGT
jgi:AcrR family transcriptional regulator